MILAVDVDYRSDSAVVAGILFQRWSDEQPSRVISTTVAPVKPYISGEFYRRELPCILKLLHLLDKRPETIVIDGHVYLGEERRPGLGKYLYDALDGTVAIIGVAKRAFKVMPEDSIVYRGQSSRPLYVTAVGIDEELARESIRTMSGRFGVGPPQLSELTR